MKRHDAIKAVTQAIKADGLADALFLKGSIARGDDDDYSDVDMYAVVAEENFDNFLARRVGYLEAYKPLVNWVEVNFVGPQIVGIYEDALHFDLYAVRPGAIPQTGEMKIIYDQQGLLAKYKPEPLALSESDLLGHINNFTYTLVEIEAALGRNDLSRGIQLFYYQYGVLALIIRYVYDKKSSLLGNKGMKKAIPPDVYNELLVMLEHATPTNFIKAVHMLLRQFENTLPKLPQPVQDAINKRFYEVLSSRVYVLG